MRRIARQTLRDWMALMMDTWPGLVLVDVTGLHDEGNIFQKLDTRRGFCRISLDGDDVREFPRVNGAKHVAVPE